MARSLARRPRLGAFAALATYFRDPHASFFGKLFVVIAALYVVWPLDLIPDVAPVVGWLDDLGIMGLALGHLGRMAARYRQVPAAIPVYSR